MTADVLCLREGAWGRIRLDRPKALHALTEAMCRGMTEALVAWRTDPTVAGVLIDHAEGRGFCAGGDVRAAAGSGQADGVAARAFFHAEYQLNHLLFVYPKPVVAVMDGVVMGGGVGIALPARYRIATERTLFAMPEATIGLFPDVGGGWYLSRLPGRIGQYLALTAARLNGADCLSIGLATHYATSEKMDGLKQRLLERPASEIEAVLEGHADLPEEATLPEYRELIDRLFAADELEAILTALEGHDGAWAQETHAALRAKSPQACKVALRLLAQGASHTDFADEIRVEYRVAARVCQRHDFVEGVRALLVDKDNAPHWDPVTPEGVTDHMLDTIFAPLAPDMPEWEPIRL